MEYLGRLKVSVQRADPELMRLRSGLTAHRSAGPWPFCSARGVYILHVQVDEIIPTDYGNKVNSIHLPSHLYVSSIYIFMLYIIMLYIIYIIYIYKSTLLQET